MKPRIIRLLLAVAFFMGLIWFVLSVKNLILFTETVGRMTPARAGVVTVSPGRTYTMTIRYFNTVKNDTAEAVIRLPRSKSWNPGVGDTLSILYSTHSPRFVSPDWAVASGFLSAILYSLCTTLFFLVCLVLTAPRPPKERLN